MKILQKVFDGIFVGTVRRRSTGKKIPTEVVRPIFFFFFFFGGRKNFLTETKVVTSFLEKKMITKKNFFWATFLRLIMISIFDATYRKN